VCLSGAEGVSVGCSVGIDDTWRSDDHISLVAGLVCPWGVESVAVICGMLRVFVGHSEEG
jgi:hypothetical protein